MDIVGVDMGGIKFRVEGLGLGSRGEDSGNGAWVIVQKHIIKKKKWGKGLGVNRRRCLRLHRHLQQEIY